MEYFDFNERVELDNISFVVNGTYKINHFNGYDFDYDEVIANIIISLYQSLNYQKILKLKKNDRLFKLNPKIKSKVKSIKNLNKKLYYVKVWSITESNDLTVLKNYSKRGFNRFHLDHIYPISEAYKNNISPDIIGNIKNLRFITKKQNLKKGNLLTEKAEKIVELLQKTCITKN